MSPSRALSSPEEGSLLDQHLLLVRHFFFLMERLFTNIMTLKSVLTSWATHERP
jgi:hypothetical protein